MMKEPQITDIGSNGSVTIPTPGVSENLLNGTSRLKEHKASAAEEANKRKARLKPSGATVKGPAGTQTPKLPVLEAITAALESSNGTVDTEYEGEDETDGIKVRFIAALTENCRTESSLAIVVAEMVGMEIDRDTAIEWGIEAGLSEGYVRSVVSKLYIELTGERKKRVGGGRKPNKGASGFAEKAMKACDDDVEKALALLLAARRMLEGWKDKGTVESNLKRLRATNAGK